MIDLEHFAGGKSKPKRKNEKGSKLQKINAKDPQKLKDTHRSTWWKDPRDPDSMAHRFEHWIKINDIRYGIEEEKERQRRREEIL